MSNLIGIYDHETGEQTVREMTKAEAKARADEIAANETAAAEAVATAAAADAKRTAILAALADSTGFTPDELREALNA